MCQVLIWATVTLKITVVKNSLFFKLYVMKQTLQKSKFCKRQLFQILYKRRLLVCTLQWMSLYVPSYESFSGFHIWSTFLLPPPPSLPYPSSFLTVRLRVGQMRWYQLRQGATWLLHDDYTDA